MTMSAGANARLEHFRQLLAHINASILPDVGFELWDKSTIPRKLPPDMPAVVIADEGAVAALIRRPSMHTMLNLWVTRRIDIRNGTIFDLAARRPAIRTRELIGSLDKRRAIAAAAKFLFVPRGGPWPLEAIRGDK